MMTTETTTIHATETSRFDKPDSKLYNVEASAEYLLKYLDILTSEY